MSTQNTPASTSPAVAFPSPFAACPDGLSTLDQIAWYRAQNTQLQARASAKAASQITLKVTEKGGLSVYGLGRFPVTLYREQWERLMGQSEAILEAVKALPTKAEKADTKAATTTPAEPPTPSEQF